MKGHLNNISEVQLNLVGLRRVRESIERLLRCGLDFFDNTDDLVNNCLINHTLWSIDEQPNVFVKFDLSRQFHINHSWPPLILLRFMLFFHVNLVSEFSVSLLTSLAASRCGGTSSHCAASLQSWNTRTLMGEPSVSDACNWP